MFQNSYQNGIFFEVFDPKLPQDKTKNLYKLQNAQANFKVFDKNLKTFIYEFVNPNSKITFPKEDKKQLYLIQQYLNLQVEFSTADWNIQLTVSDLTKTKRRIILSPAVHKTQKKPFFVKYPCPHSKAGMWMNLCIDLYSFIQAFKGQTYRSLDMIQITGGLKLRRIFTTNHGIFGEQEIDQTHQNILLPKILTFPPQIQNQKYFVHFQEILNHDQHSEHTQSTSKSTSHILSSKNIKKQPIKKQKQAKTQKQLKPKKEELSIIETKQQTIQQNKPQKPNIQKNFKKQHDNQRKFLANTNGLQGLKINKRDNKNDISLEDASKGNITPLSTGKVINKKRQPLSKTQIHKQKQKKISIQKKGGIGLTQKSIKVQKKKQNQKLNPWRSSGSNKKNETGRCEADKLQNQRKVQSAEASLFKTKNNLAQRFNQTKNKNSDQCESDYFELSQKFSTVTEGRFFKNQLASKNFQQQNCKEVHDQIQQNIEIQTSSHYSNSNPNSAAKNKQNLCIEFARKPIEESINDSLDQFNVNKKPNKQSLTENQSYFNMSSRFGFGQKMMNKFMKQLQRPYSPPLGQRQYTQQHQPQIKQFNQDKGVQLIYDPVLNCYYDHKTHTYYELKN